MRPSVKRPSACVSQLCKERKSLRYFKIDHTTQRSINPTIAAPTSPNPLTARPTAPFPLLWLDPADELGELPEPVEPEGAPDDVPEAVKEAVGVAEEAG